MVNVGSRVQQRGALFDGRALRALDEFTTAAVEAVAEQGVVAVRGELDRVLQNPSGFYESQIATDRVSDERQAVTDQGVVYGPWLAGVGSRNATSDFGGYDHWRQATQQVDQRAQQVAERVLPPFLDRMNG